MSISFPKSIKGFKARHGIFYTTPRGVRLNYYKIFLSIFLTDILAVRAYAASRCFAGIRVESLSNAINAKQESGVVTFSFSYAATSRSSPRNVINAPVDVSRPGATFVLNTALNSGSHLTLCFSDPTEIELFDTAIRKKTESGKSRHEIHANSLTDVAIPYLK